MREPVMNKTKSVLLILLSLCLLLGGCGGGSDVPVPTKQGQTLPGKTTEAETTKAETESSPEGPQKEEVIEVYDLTEEMISVDEASGAEYVNSIVVIYFDEDTTEEERQQIAAGIGGTVVGRIDVLDQLQVKVAATDLEGLTRICEELEKDKRVDLAVFDSVAQTEAREPVYPLDGSYLSWDPDGRINRNWAHLAVESPKAWAYADLLEPVTVGILDSGFDFSHPDLKNVLRKAEASADISADHGTHVAGIIGADAENGIGIRGVAPNAKMVGLTPKRNFIGRISDTALDTSVVELIFEGAKIVNCSIGFRSYPGDSYNNSRAKAMSRTLGKLIQCGWDFLVVQSAGNNGADTYYNGYYCSVNDKTCDTKYASKEEIMSRIIIVTDARRNGKGYLMSSYSSGGDGVDLCAPGMNLYSTVTLEFWKDKDGYKDEDGMFDRNQSDAMARDNYYYGYMSGTSMAAPVVSAVAALVWGADPSLTGPQVKKLICAKENTPILVKDNPESKTKGDFRMVNAWLPTLAALQSAGKVDENGNVPGEEPETETETVQPETTAAPGEDHSAERKIYREFMKNATEGGGFYPIAPDWLYVDNAYFYTTYLARFGIADVDFDGEEELIVYWNQMSQQGSFYAYKADLRHGDCSYTEKGSKSFPTLSTDVDLIYYSGGSVELIDHETGYHHFGVFDRTFWSRHPELNIPEYAQYYTYLSVPDQPKNGYYHCLIEDSADRAGRDVSTADMKALLAELRAGESVTVPLYAVTQENIDQVLR